MGSAIYSRSRYHRSGGEGLETEEKPRCGTWSPKVCSRCWAVALSPAELCGALDTRSSKGQVPERKAAWRNNSIALRVVSRPISLPQLLPFSISWLISEVSAQQGTAEFLADTLGYGLAPPK